MNAYYERGRTSVADQHSIDTVFGDRLISLICTLVAFFTSAIAVKVEKAILSTICFVGFFGIIGSMETGNIGLFFGLLLCTACSLLEFFIFKSLIKSNRSSK